MNNTLSSYFYKFSERILTHATTFIVSIVLARLLSPADYGTLAILLVFVTLSQVVVEGGLSSSLIQKEGVEETDYNTTLSITIFLASFFYICLFLGSDYLEAWFRMEGLSCAFRIVALVLFPSAYLSVIKAKMVREMNFKAQMYVTFMCSVLSGVFGIIMAYQGYGIWSLIIQQLSNTILSVLLFAIILKWLPKIVFRIDIHRAKELYDYGYKIMLTNLLVRGNNEIVSLAIGKHFSKASLGLYDRGKQFPQAAAENFEGTIQSVLFPILSRYQKDHILVKQKTRDMQLKGAYVIFFIIALLAGSSPTYIPLLLNEQWVGCVPFLILWCICYAPSIYSIVAVTAINAVGNSNMTLKRQLLGTIPSLIVVLLVVLLSNNAIMVMVAKVAMLPYGLYITAYYLRKSINYTIREQLIDQFPYICIGLATFIAVYLMNFIYDNRIVVLILQGILGTTTYYMLSYILKIKGYEYLPQGLRKIRNHNWK